jgi:hypothetical protein
MEATTTGRLEAAANAFRRLAETARTEAAPLYEHLCLRIADDVELLEMAALARPGQSMPYLLFDAVHFLLLGGVAHELRAFYPSLTQSPSDPAAAYPVFREFCLVNASEIRRLIPAHDNQTNEVGRMAALLPAISEAARLGGDRPLGIVEVGPSAGLNLCFDRYFFDYGRVQWGDPSASVRFTCALEDEATPPLVGGRPSIAYRIGLDLEPIDVTDEAAARWMLSSTWPDHRDLSELQSRAIDVVRGRPVARGRARRPDLVRLPVVHAESPFGGRASGVPAHPRSARREASGVLRLDARG